jgi:hypothetical protein
MSNLTECSNCKSIRLITIQGKCCDKFSATVEHLSLLYTGYAPNIPDLCKDKYIDFTFCLDCLVIQDLEPIEDSFLLENLCGEE